MLLFLSGCSKLQKGTIYSFSSFGFPEKSVCHQYYIGKIENYIEGNQDFQFIVVDGLDGHGSISFESVNFPDYYLRHSNFKLILSQKEEDENFAKDASFYIRDGLGDQKLISFESVNFPNYFIRHSNFILYVMENDNSEIFKADATFKPIKR